MEKPYNGRAIFQDNVTELQIVIPAKRNWFVIIFLGAWLCGWFMGESFALASVTGLLHGGPVGAFLVIWLIGWTVGGFFAFRFFLWNLIGKEIITIGQGVLKLEKKGALLVKPKEYDLKAVKKIRVQEDIGSGFGGYGAFGGQRRNGLVGYVGGTIRFDYGMQTVKFAGGIDEAEARYILTQLSERHLLSEENYE